LDPATPRQVRDSATGLPLYARVRYYGYAPAPGHYGSLPRTWEDTEAGDPNIVQDRSGEKSGRELVSSKNHILIAPVHIFTKCVRSACTGTCFHQLCLDQ